MLMHLSCVGRPVTVAVFLAVAGFAQTNRTIYTVANVGGSDSMGYAIAGCGDVDHDGLADVVVGVPFDHRFGNEAGSARVLGRGGREILTLPGVAPGDHWGTSVAGLGDVNRDGWLDVIVGAPEAGNRGAGSGSARVYSGRDGSVLYAVDGDRAADECGYAVGSAGDIDRDGFPDFIVGYRRAAAPRPGTGIARVYSGRDGHVLLQLQGEAEEDHFGACVGEVGDVNGDGWTDIGVGAPQADIGFLGCGSAYVFSGRDGTMLYRFTGDGRGYEMGTAVAKVGDIDGDGYAEIYFSEAENKVFGDDAGSVKLYSGRTGALLLQLYGSAPYEYFGETIGAGDFDADGVTDLVVGAFLEDTGAPNGGAIYVYSGATFQRIFAGYGQSNSDQLGRSVDFAGDIDGDGIGDIVAGIANLSTGGNGAGGVRAYCGVPAAAATFTFGHGCPMTQPLTMAFAGQPRAGQAFQIQVNNVPSAASVAWIVLAGHGQQAMDLTAFGMTGCALYQPLDIVVPIAVASGAGTLPLTAPELGAACGLQLAAQAIAWGPGVNPLGVLTSNGGRIVVAR